MFKKFFSYSVFLIIFLSFLGFLGFGSLIKYHYEGGHKYKSLRKIAIFISSIPINARNIIKKKTFNLNELQPLTKHKNKKRFKKFLQNERNGLLIVPRFDFSLNRSVVDVIDLKTFTIIHTYKHDIDKMGKLIKNVNEFPYFNRDHSSKRFQYTHPLILNDGSLISDGNFTMAFKIDLCSNLIWINDEEKFHHSKMLDHERNIWVAGQMKPASKYVENSQIRDFKDDSIIKIDTEGNILYNKSVTEILIENKLADINIFNENLDPIHLNDIEPTFSDTNFWKKGDIFLSSRHLSAIIHFRPSTNKVINYITGPFSQQHDVDVVSDREISIFDNNNFLLNNKFSQILIYNFETGEFKKLFNDELKTENFKTTSQGLSHIFKDGSLMVEEQNHGRIILFNNKGEKEWEFVNKDKNGNIGFVSWSRVIEDELFTKRFKSLVKNQKCLN